MTYKPEAGPNMDRRKFIKRASGLIIAGPCVIRPSAAAAPPPSEITIPMSLSDARFAGNVPGPGGPFSSGTQANKDWIDSPNYKNGDACFAIQSSGSLVSNFVQCRIDWREGPRQNGGGITNMDQCFFNCVAKVGDHSDAFQAYPYLGDNATVNFTNCSFKCYNDNEPQPGFVSSDCMQWADNFSGTVTYNNCIFWNGDRTVFIFASPGTTTNVAFTNCYFATPGGRPGFHIAAVRTGVLNVLAWSNVRLARVVGTTIIPGALIRSP
ncbi:hypothetical protein [Bradyrhizobium neotropicale]|uniref:hypothetical protein n=1 Tax=Bradyrhizobium neotropicale TaxID=1497615 RepID=UPI001AD7ACFB|nr:hypothetical protein [Bradyrhizobium neotropicale]MBO4227701.1 hypothetical protein [Bradyrhizobium neotropicale]